METETITQKAITEWEEEEADEWRRGQMKRKQNLGCLGEVRAGRCVELTSSLAGPGAMPEHSKG